MDFKISITQEFLDKVQDFIENPEFNEFCLSHSTNVDVPGFIMSVVFNEIDRYRELLDEEEKM